jgi:ABC-type polysaccharide/polyol phosphate transport system ATPase subunit
MWCDMALVELNDVSKRYNIYERPIDRLKEMMWRNRRCFHREYWAVRNVNLVVEPGCTTALMGPNGAGKSTILQIIAGVVQPTTGTVNVTGRLTAILELGAGFQMDYTGRENALVYGMILGISREEMLERMDEIAAFAELGDFFDQPVKFYSSGMIVRLAFAACINVDPEILIVDEALAVGDVRFQEKCIRKVHALQDSGKTIILVSHSADIVKQFCTRAVLINEGRVVEQGLVDDIVPIYDELMEAGELTPKRFLAPGAVPA